VKILGIAGSLRAASFNRWALKAAQEVAPSGMTIEIVELHDIPLFDGDDFAKGYPASVTAFREKIGTADGLIVTSPEYNHSISGVLKNAIDWASRGNDQPFAMKPVAIFSATTGPVGGARSQYDVRKILASINAQCLLKPEVFIGNAQTKFDATTGKLTDEPTRKILSEQMVALEDWVQRMQRMQRMTA
jgi:chromate reductase, NAD(P)H dehydrogenase (quinone)